VGNKCNWYYKYPFSLVKKTKMSKNEISRQGQQVQKESSQIIIDDICFLSYLFIYFMAGWDLCAEVWEEGCEEEGSGQNPTTLDTWEKVG
jgi:hypothetical protein